ncbi:MAG: NYN domain-containing protein [Clostridiales bacterium]|nr:NYN domain-containing protein [Clostridiales bacterium]
MSTSRFALFVDLENCGAKVATLNNILEKVKIRGDILLGKVYGYTDRFSDLKEILLSNTFTVVPSLRHGVAQKNNADILLVLDALEVAYTNPLIDSFCIVSGDSDYTPLVGRLKSMGKFVLGISRSEVASTIFINACNEFQFLESVSSVSRDKRSKQNKSKDDPLDDAGLNKLLEGILSEQTDEDEMYASELKGVLLRLRPDFNEKAFGCASFGKLLNKLSNKFGTIRVKNDNYNVLVSLNSDAPEEGNGKKSLTADTWRAAFSEQLQHYKDDGFERINPSILKADIQTAYPDFSERAIGFKRFSDVLKQMEKDGLLKLEMDNQRNMLIKML